MEPAPEWTAEVEGSLAAVVATVLTAGRNAEAQPLWQFLQRGGRLPAGRLPRAALAGPTVYEAPLFGDDRVRPAPGAAGAPPLHSASTVGHHVAALTPHGEVLCSEHPQLGLAPVRLPWPAAAVSCGQGAWGREDRDKCYAVARQRGGGALCQWRLGTGRHGRGVPAAPEVLRGLPPGDPVVLVEAGVGIAVALTASGVAYGWGDDFLFRHLGASYGAVVRIPQLSGRRIRRLACGALTAAAETEEGQLLSLGMCDPTTGNASSLTLAQLLADAAVAFPLRDMVTMAFGAMVIVDAAGHVWEIDYEAADQSRLRCEPLHFPPAARGQRAVRMVVACDEYDGAQPCCCVALTDSVELWRLDYDEDTHGWARNLESISAAHPELPRGLQPYGGLPATRIMLLPDLSCGKARLQLFARIAARLGLPSDPVRTAVLRAAVQGCYIVGPEHDPFGWPTGRAAGVAAAGL